MHRYVVWLSLAACGGSSADAALSVDPPSRDFGRVTVGTTSPPQTFTVTNGGDGAAAGVSAALSDGARFQITSTTCGAAGAEVTVGAGQTCTIAVAFSPPAATADGDTLVVSYDGGSVSVPLSGTGLGGAAVTHGLAIPAEHPRLWFDATRLAAARAWYQGHPTTPDPGDLLGQATRAILGQDADAAAACVSLAIAQNEAMPASGGVCDDCRWLGERVLLAFDWCYDAFTPAQRTAFVQTANQWVSYWSGQSWGAPPGHANNYYSGYTRNELEWAITSYTDNPTVADTLLDDVFTTRLGDDLYPAAASGGDMVGGVPQEGSDYGWYQGGYYATPLTSAWLLGRDLFAETGFWRELAYYHLYTTSMAPTTGGHPNQAADMGYTIFPFGDNESWLAGNQLTPPYDDWAGNYMTAVATRWSGTKLGAYARGWLDVTGATREAYVEALDPGGTAAALTDLPLDYYASGTRYLYGRSAWDPAGTTFFWQLGTPHEQSHRHQDWATFQIWRKGRYLTRESVSYGEPIADYGGSGTTNAGFTVGHNALLIDGTSDRIDDDGVSREYPEDLMAQVTRLESQPGYTFASVDLDPLRQTTASSNDNGNPAFVHWVRDLVFVRDLETTVILDRVQSSAAGAVKAQLVHSETQPALGAGAATITSGDQALAVTTLVPATSTYRTVDEGGTVGQYRIEILTSPGTAQSYILTVLQAKDASAASLSPSVVDDGGTYTLTLDADHAIVLAKGMSSTGGSITIGGTSHPFRADVQPMTVTDSGPAWQ